MELHVGTRTFEAGRIFCIGRNYAAHAAELGNAVPESPVVFMKPPSCLVPLGEAITVPRHGRELHYEGELVVVIGRHGRAAGLDEARGFVAGLGLGLDLTLRDVQNALKSKGLPWEKAKAFDGSSPLGPLVGLAEDLDLGALQFTCEVDGEVRQRGDTSLLLFPITRLLVELSAIWALRPGDLVYTGTPEGVGPLHPGQRIRLSASFAPEAEWVVGSP